jgi:NAD(P)-dependent dehydrogenase (short-subunit alcohol dehydrogenase family)
VRSSTTDRPLAAAAKPRTRSPSAPSAGRPRAPRPAGPRPDPCRRTSRTAQCRPGGPHRGSGFGREWAIAALDRGDKVAATARDSASLDDLAAKYGDALLPIELDVTDRDADFAAVKQAHDHFGRLDVIVNNAGYGHFGMVEEVSEQEIRAQLETNMLGALLITQAALPYLREQGSGHILQVSSIGGISAFMTTGAYHASKWALEGLSQSLAQEVAGFGVKVTLIEPAGYSTDWSGSSAKHSAELPAYAPVRQRAQEARKGRFPGARRSGRYP